MVYEEMKKLNVAVLGASTWGMAHVRVYKELDSVNLVAICDINKEKVDAIAGQYKVKSYTDSSLMFKSEEIDAVSVCTLVKSFSQRSTYRIRRRKTCFG